MPNERDNKNQITDSHERFREEDAIEEHDKHYRAENNGLVEDEDDLPNRQMIKESADKNEYIDEP
jgi:hypothetical protein